MPQRLRLRRVAQREEIGAGARHRVGEGHVDRAPHGGDDFLRRRLAATLAGSLFVALKDFRHRLGQGPVCGAPRSGFRAHDPAREGHCRGAEIVADNLVDEAFDFRRVDRARLAVEHHRQRGVEADQTWQQLGSARAGQKSEIDFRQADARAAHGDAVMAAGRELAAAAERVAVKGSDHRLRCVRKALNHVGQMRRLRWQVEFADIGAGTERGAGAGQDDRPDAVVGRCRVECAEQPGTHVAGQRVHRGMVDRDHGDGAVARERHDGRIGGQGGRNPRRFSRNARTRIRSAGG